VAPAALAPLTTAGGGNTAGAFTLATNTVTVVNAGTYLLEYRVAILTQNAVFALFVNGTQVPGTNGASGTVTGNPARQLGGAAAVTLTAGATVSVRNVSTTADTLAGATLEGAAPTSVMLTLLKVG
jgi:hypothetical protein